MHPVFTTNDIVLVSMEYVIITIPVYLYTGFRQALLEPPRPDRNSCVFLAEEWNGHYQYQHSN